jgi:hypothetical protein
MSLSLEQILSRLEDPATPVVWLDPALPESLWENLPSYAASRGYQVLNLGDQGPIFDLDSLMAALGRLLGWPAAFDHSLPSLRRALAAFPCRAEKGLLVVFRNPDALRQNAEAAFEEFIEALEAADELRRNDGRPGLKAVVRD